MAIDRGHATCVVDHRGDIFDLALDGVGQCIAAVATPTAIIIIDGELWREALSQARGAKRTRIHSAADEDHRGARARLVKGDRRPIARGNGIHSSPLWVSR